MRTRYEILAKGRTKTARGEMNKTEARYAECLTADPAVVEWWYEPTRFRISHPEKGTSVSAWYTPDFMVLFQTGDVAFDDVKSGGMNNEAAAVRNKAVAEKYPLFVFRAVHPVKKKDGGGWRLEVM